MSALDWAVIATGVALIALINWYFFFSTEPSATAQVGGSGVAVVPIVVEGGYTPNTVHVAARREGAPGLRPA